MTGAELLVLVAVLAVGMAAAVAAMATVVARGRRRRNRVVPEVDTDAPASWAGAHTPLARLHRRLRGAVEVARAVPDPDGALIRARVEVEQAALDVDRHLVALHAMAERDRAGRMAQASAAVAAVESAAGRLADAAASSLPGAAPGALPAVEEALERARLVADARRELDEDPAAILDATEDGRTAGAVETERTDGDEPRSQPGTG